MTLKQVIIIDRETQILYSDVIKTVPLVCREHKVYVVYDKDSDGFRCKKGKHIVFVEEGYELVEL